MDSATYYKHSGRVGFTTPAYFCLLGPAVLLVSSYIYGYITSNSPLVLLNSFFLLIFSSLIGLVVTKCSILSKARNIRLSIAVGICFAIIGQYLSWIVWVNSQGDFSQTIYLPLDLLNQIIYSAERGVWLIFGWQPSKSVYLVFWISEILITISIAVLFILSSVRIPFCESCKSWIYHESCITPLPHISNPELIISQIENGDYQFLESLKRLEHYDSKHSEIVIRHCSSCHQVYLMDINAVYMVKKKGKEITKYRTIVENMHIDRDIYDKIVAF